MKRRAKRAMVNNHRHSEEKRESFKKIVRCDQRPQDKDKDTHSIEIVRRRCRRRVLLLFSV